MTPTPAEIDALLVGTKYEGATEGNWVMIGTGLAGFGDTYAICCEAGVVVQAGARTFDGVECGIKGMFNASLIRDSKLNAAEVIQLTALVREMVEAINRFSDDMGMNAGVRANIAHNNLMDNPAVKRAKGLLGE